ncbi:MAG: succinate dehydrogenase, hydrophobic membrane anchor protein [Thiocapsa sp.]|jgi:succinate dehydrogenase / fumarate reductase membrane anchor subunit|nr:succinate dehydrogenase, hydrophobic membrane anchor protein [Thiocapsa sp.]MCG6895558.1 succinate dehydrogenase, hydrophobic membrane anchor protein [Thiocapsa sp.]MCG6986196.1 succinate dehydrogenase, hydrophobic membrane anchor protein [Thiocapsa sp.]
MSRQASGLMAWVVQRATSVYLAIFLTYLLVHFVFNAPAGHAALVNWVAHPVVALSLLLFVPVLLAHAWVGIRDVLIDYVHNLGLRLGLLTLVAFTFIASGLWGIKAIITAGLWG